MDSLTHLLVGHAMGVTAASAAGPHGVAAYWAVLIGNSAPDIDVPISLLLRRDVKLHRTVTHTLPGAAVLSLLTAAGMSWFIPGSPFALVFMWTLLGCLAHMAMDCLNLFGARALWPLSGRTIELGVLHILDPVLMLVLGLTSAAVALHLAPQQLLSVAFIGIWPYILYRMNTARKLYRMLKQAGSIRARVIPWYGTWRYVFETPQTIEFGFWQGGRPKAMRLYPKQESALIQASLLMPEVEVFLRSAEYPYAQIEEDEHGPSVIWGDALRQLRADFRPVRVRIEA